MKVKKSYFIYERLEDIKTYIKEGEKDKNNTHNTMQSYKQYTQTYKLLDSYDTTGRPVYDTAGRPVIQLLDDSKLIISTESYKSFKIKP